MRDAVKCYTNTILDLENCPVPQTSKQVRAFYDLLGFSFGQQKDVVGAVAKGTRDLVERLGPDYETARPQVDACLEGFYGARVALRFLLQQHAEARRPSKQGFSGVIQQRCSPAEIAQEAARVSAQLCRAHLGRSAPIVVCEAEPELLMLVPSELRYVMTEVFKNASRAVVEKFGCEAKLPPIRCVIEGSEDSVTITIRDEGPGMCEEQVNKLFTFAQSTFGKSPYKKKEQNCLLGPKPPGTLAGYGVGLALSRISMRHFGGDLQLSSSEGQGTEVRIRLSRTPAPATE